MRFLQGKGLTRAQAAGVVGSLMQESGLSTTAKNPSSGAYGIGQWLGGRKTNLLNQGDPKSLHGQLNFLWSELQGPEKAALDRLRGARTVADAAAAFTWGFERPGRAEANMANRIRQGRAALRFAGGGGAQASASSQTTTTTPGQTGESTVTSGGDFRVQQLPEREKPTVSAPALPGYVKAAVANVTPLPKPAKDAALKDAIAKLGVVPTQQTTEQWTTPGQTAPQTAQTPSSGGSGKGGSKVLELIFNDGGKGYGIKDGQAVNGQQVFNAVWGGHANHVHVAAGPKTVVALGKVAERMGLHVGENKAFGGVDPVHVPGSYHYKNEAIDVSGDQRLMGKFARYVANYNRKRELPA
jgi:hypothetical protein